MSDVKAARNAMRAAATCALALAAGCVIEAQDSNRDRDDALFDATWTVSDVGGSNTGCPMTETIAAVTAQPIDAIGSAAGSATTTLFDCSADFGELALTPALYVATLQIEDDAHDVIATSQASMPIDLTLGDATTAFAIFTDGGYVSLAWKLVGSDGSGQACGSANVSNVIVDVGGANPFPCNQGSALVGPVVAGSYAVTAAAVEGSDVLGSSAPTTVTVGAQSSVTALGTLEIAVPSP